MEADAINAYVIERVRHHRIEQGLTVAEMAKGQESPWAAAPAWKRAATGSGWKTCSGSGSLYQADCLDFLPSLPPASVDMVFADPPFNLGKDYRNRRSDSLGEGEYLDWCRSWVAESARLLKPGGAMFVYQLPR